jgi:hypothetical protein
MADAGAIVGPLMHGILTLVMVVGRGFLLAMWAGHERLHAPYSSIYGGGYGDIFHDYDDFFGPRRRSGWGRR